MNIIKNQINTFLFSLLLFTPYFAIAGDGVIWEAGPNVYFKYADQDESNFGKNDHPIELEKNEISAVLNSLKLREEEKPGSNEGLKPVFSDQQVDILGLYLAKGLKNAKQEQDIIFAMEKSGSNILGFNSDRFFVAGRAFYNDNKLNIILGDYDRPRNKGYEAAYDPTHVGIVRYNFNHGRRSKRTAGFNKTIVLVDGVENKLLRQTRRDDWLVIDVKATLAASDHKARMHKKQEMEKKRSEIRDIMEDEEISRPKKTSGSLEERLTTLKRLRDKYLISEEEYTQKKQQMLDEL